MPSHRASLPSLGGTIGLAFRFGCSAGSRKKAWQHWCLRPLPRRLTYAGILPDGAVRVSQVPGESSRNFAMLNRPRPRPSCHCHWASEYRPRQTEHEGRSILVFSRLIHTASLLAVYASSFGFPALARLASGRVTALTGWVSNPLDSSGEFQSGFTSPSIPTPQA